MAIQTIYVNSRDEKLWRHAKREAKKRRISTSELVTIALHKELNLKEDKVLAARRLLSILLKK